MSNPRPNHSSDSAIDPEAMVREHYASVYRFCCRRIGADWASDAAQETFLTALKQLHRFEGKSLQVTWLFGIAQNHCRNMARKHRIEWLTLDRWHDPDRDQADCGGESATSIIDRRALQEALEHLTPDQRDVVVLRELEGLTYDEAAAVLGVPSGTVKSRLHHAFIHLRQLMVGPSEVTA